VRCYLGEGKGREGHVALDWVLLLESSGWRVEGLVLAEDQALGGHHLLHRAGHVHVLLCLFDGGLHGVCCLREGCCQGLRCVGTRPLLLSCWLSICRLLPSRRAKNSMQQLAATTRLGVKKKIHPN